jgi:hypothetical protein
MSAVKVASWLVDRVEAGLASDASLWMHPHRREFSYQVSFAGPPATRRPTNRTQAKGSDSESARSAPDLSLDTPFA